MNLLCRMTRDDGGEEIPKEDQVWCLQTPYADGAQKFCTGEYFGYGEGDALAETKRATRGGITCPQCLDQIKQIKAVRL